MATRLYCIGTSSLSVFVLLAALLLGISPNAPAQDRPNISANLSTDRLSVDARARLLITVHGDGSANIEIPEVENLLFHRRGQHSKMQVINGKVSSSTTSVYTIEPLEPGKYTIPPITAEVGGTALQTKPLLLEVLSGEEISTNGGNRKKSATSPTARKTDEICFVTIDGLPQKAYRGELLPITIKIYFRRGVRAELDTLPKIAGDGFVLSPLSDDPRQTRETSNGNDYSVLSWDSSITPIKEGEHALRIGVEATLLLPGRRTIDPFFNDDFFNGFFGRVEQKKVRPQSKQHIVVVDPLPKKGRPADFSGAIGSFDFQVTAAPQTVEVGEPVTLTMEISGKGNFDRVSAPAFPAGQNWKSYSPTSRFQSEGSSYEGSKIFEQAIVAKNSSPNSIPALSFSYFDPQRREYISSASSPLPLQIKATAKPQGPRPAAPEQSSPLSPQNSTKNQAASASKAASSAPPAKLHLTATDFTREIVPVYRSGWFITFFLVCTATLGIVLAIALRRRFIAAHRPFFTRKQLRRDMNAGFARLQQAMDNNDEESFFRLCREIVQHRLASAWNMEPSTITLHDLQRRLPEGSPLIRIFAEIERNAYCGADKGQMDRGEMKDMSTMLQRSLEDVP